ncbi:MAG: hypothetical protein QGI10_16220 [Vicinamibacterales bacterium]|nr:hypothetical protein [Vicinamibacterales bacterium]MDP7480806.1 hypothetical protein [Vicinamibacterales bacterium]MDP7691955.1 hypothetical protein [Vicinamibacterales bacterium]HJN44871.1 hypothetical protein [Vicinamibacterales bacterium]
MNKTLVIALVLVGALDLPLSAAAQSDPVDTATLGPQVGEIVPNFILQDHRGETRTLASLQGPRGLMLVFNRSADW